MKIFGYTVTAICLLILILAVRHATHSSPDWVKKTPSVATAPASDCYNKDAVTAVAVAASKNTVDIIVNKMLDQKFIIVNKDGMSYRFKLVKKFKQQPVKK